MLEGEDVSVTRDAVYAAVPWEVPVLCVEFLYKMTPVLPKLPWPRLEGDYQDRDPPCCTPRACTLPFSGGNYQDKARVLCVQAAQV